VNPLFLILEVLPILGAIGVMVLAQTQVRERSERAALPLMIGAGLEVAYALAHHFMNNEVLFLAGGFVHVGAVGGVVYGLMVLVDDLHPKVPSPLPPIVANLNKSVNVVPRVMLGGFGCLAIFGTGAARMQPAYAVIGALMIAASMVGSIWVERQGPLGNWALERRPDLVVWAYVYQLRVINRQTGSTSVHWSARMGLATGLVVNMPATGEHHAQSLVAAIAQRCPGIALGYSADLLNRFKANPQSMRAGGGGPQSFAA
jgi:hypothetical protein